METADVDRRCERGWQTDATSERNREQIPLFQQVTATRSENDDYR
jgi:hypothetical protein